MGPTILFPGTTDEPEDVLNCAVCGHTFTMDEAKVAEAKAYEALDDDEEAYWKFR
jgi:hypothetical protein